MMEERDAFAREELIPGSCALGGASRGRMRRLFPSGDQLASTAAARAKFRLS
jgi:hypothetical protein